MAKLTGRLLDAIARAWDRALPDVSDRELLRRYADDGDQDAFALLVRRYSRLVLGVCRHTLGSADAEDVCQATFLVLARKAKTGRWQHSVANWLYATSTNLARTARTARNRRARREQRAAVPDAVPSLDTMTAREMFEALAEELERLPVIYREPLVLGFFENMTREEIATRLGVPAGTVKTRLERGKQRLGQALARRGVVSGLGLLAFLATSRAGASGPKLVESVLAAVGGSPSPTAAALAQGVTMNGIGRKVVLGLVAAVMTVGAGVGWHRGEQVAAQTKSDEKPLVQAAGPAAGGQPAPKAPPPAAPVAVRGRVLGPDGKPAAGAKLFVIADGRSEPAGQAAADAGGAFAFTVPASPGFEYRYVLARAASVGCDWAVIPAYTPPGELTLRLPEDVPITGRILDLEGRPVAGARLTLEGIDATKSGNLDEFLKQYPGRYHGKSVYLLDKRLSRSLPAAGLFDATTDAKGGFTVRGIGRDRVPAFLVSAEGYAQQAVRVVTRQGLKEPFDPARHRFRVTGPDFTLALPPTRPVTGVVRDEVTKRPVPGVRVSYQFEADAAFLGRRHVIETTTGPDGRYTLRGAPTTLGTVVLFDTTPDRGYLHRYVKVDGGDAFGQATVDVDLPRGVVVEGRLTDRDTGGGVRARVWYRPMEDNRTLPKTLGYDGLDDGPAAVDDTARTDADGRFKLTALPGPGLLHIETRGLNPVIYLDARLDPKDRGRLYHSTLQHPWDAFRTGGRGRPAEAEGLAAYAEIDPKAGDTVRLDLSVRPGRSRTLRILEPDGKAVAGVQGTLGPRDGFVTVGDNPVATGLDPDRPRWLFFRQRGLNLFARVELKGTEAEPVEVRLEPTASVTGRVVDAGGKGVPGVAISPDYQDHPLGTLLNTENLRGGPAVKTDQAGRFTLAGVPPGTKLRLTATRGNDDYWNSGEMTLKAGQVLDLGDWKR